MGPSNNFDLSEALTAYLDDPQSILTPEADPALLDCENDADAFSPGLVNNVLDPIADAVGDHPESILRPNHLNNLEFLLKCVYKSFRRLRQPKT